MSESLFLRRQLEGILHDFLVILVHLFVPVFFSVVCFYHVDRMPNKSSSFSDDAFLEFVHLTKQQLPKLKTASEIFVAFHEQLESLFPPLIHIRYRTLSDTSNSLHFSISLFPPDFTTESHRSKCSAASVSNFNDRVVPTSSSKAKEEPILVEFVNKVIAFNSERKLHWSNCCVFNLVKSRGPVVQTPPSWSVGCTAAYHAAYIKGDLIHSRDYEKLGPHFVDWEELRNKKEAKSMIAVPLYASKKKPRAVLGMASTEKNTFKCEEVVLLLASLLVPYVEKLLSFSTRRTEMQNIVNSILSPIASHINQCPNLEDKGSSSVRRQACKNERFKKRLFNLELSRCNGVSYGNGHIQFNSLVSSSSYLNLQSYPVTDSVFSLGDFLFNLVNLCFVYVYLSKVAMKGHTCVAMFLCFCLWSLDLVFLVTKYLGVDHNSTQGVLTFGICQIYRVFITPMANIWMSWRVLNHFGIQTSTHFILLFTLCLFLCTLLGNHVRFWVQVPIQLLSIILASVSSPDLCNRFVLLPIYPFLCLGLVSTLQSVVAYLFPMTMSVQNLGACPRTGEVPLRKCKIVQQTQLKCNFC